MPSTGEEFLVGPLIFRRFPADKGHVEMHLDCKGLRCPMPIVKIGMAIRGIEPGSRLTVEATDPAFEPDLAAWSRKTGHRVIEFAQGQVQRAVVEEC